MIPMMIIMMRNDFDQKVDDEGRGQETPSRGASTSSSADNG